MKINFLKLIVIALFTSTQLSFITAGSSKISFATPKKVIIENPSYEIRNTGIYEISKIELTKSSTRIYIHCTFIPHWWVMFSKNDFIRDCKSGQKYNPTGIEGGEFDKYIWMPDSGDSTILLIFPKLEKSVEKIDFNESIFGISLKPGKSLPGDYSVVPAGVTKWIEEELAKTSNKTPCDFNSSMFFNSDTAHLIGYIKGYDTRSGFSTGIIYTSNPLTREDYPTVIQIYPDGRFEADFLIHFPSYSYFVMNDHQTIPFYLEPGQTLAVILNWEEFLAADRLRNIRYQFKDIIYLGALSKINTELIGFPKEQPDYADFQDKIKKLSPDSFKSRQLADLSKNMEKVNSYINSNSLSPKASVILNNEILLRNTNSLFDFVSRRDYEARQDTNNVILKMSVPDSYYDFLKELPLNDNSLLVSNEFQVFVNRFEFSNPFRKIYEKPRSNSIILGENFLNYLKDENIVVPEEDMKVLKRVFGASLADKNDSVAPLIQSEIDSIFQKYNPHINAFVQTINKPGINQLLEDWKFKDSVLTDVFGLKSNLVYEIAKIRQLGFQFQTVEAETAREYWDSLQTGISNKYLIQTGYYVLNKAFPDNPTAAYKLPEGKATEIFKKIVDPFKGKILFVDFWATTCGPCVYGIKNMKENREKYKNNADIDFIFITDERSSPESAYKKLVDEQGLKNTIRLSTDDFYYLRQLFRFNGIPRYVVIDKNGDVIDGDFKMYNFENELIKILSMQKTVVYND